MEDLLNFLKCIGDENRLRMLKLLLDSQYCVCQMQEVLDKSQSSISQHLSYFKELGLLKEEKSGKWIYYSIDRTVYDSYLAKIPKLQNKIDNLDTAAEIRTENKERGCC